MLFGASKSKALCITTFLDIKEQGRSQRSKKRKGGAENLRKIGVKSIVLELKKTYRYKSSSLINFQNNETG